MMQETGCDGVMIARGALGDPWLFERVNAAIEGLPAPKEPNLQARMNALRRQVEEMVEQKGEFVAMPQARAQTMHYMKGLKGAAALRRYCCTLTHLEDLDELIAAVFEEQRKAEAGPRRCAGSAVSVRNIIVLPGQLDPDSGCSRAGSAP